MAPDYRAALAELLERLDADLECKPDRFTSDRRWTRERGELLESRDRARALLAQEPAPETKSQEVERLGRRVRALENRLARVLARAVVIMSCAGNPTWNRRAQKSSAGPWFHARGYVWSGKRFSWRSPVPLAPRPQGDSDGGAEG